MITSFFLYYSTKRFEKKVGVLKNLVLIEHECMGPNWTHAEGVILGVGAKMFTVAGPVIVYGTLAGTVYGVIDWVVQLL
jgi:hypothetical protein